MNRREDNIQDPDADLLADILDEKKSVSPPPPVQPVLPPPPERVDDVRGIPVKLPPKVEPKVEPKPPLDVKDDKKDEKVKVLRMPQPVPIDVKAPFVSLFADPPKAPMAKPVPVVTHTVHVEVPVAPAKSISVKNEELVTQAFQEFMHAKSAMTTTATPVAHVTPQMFGAPSESGVSTGTPNQAALVHRAVVAPQVFGTPSNTPVPVNLVKSTKVSSLKDTGSSWAIVFSDGRSDEFYFTKYGGKDAARRALSTAHGV